MPLKNFKNRSFGVEGQKNKKKYLYMKKIVLFVAAAVLGTVSASAQFYVGGALDISTNSTDEKSPEGKTSSFGYSVEPTVGYAFSHKFDAGLSFGYGNESEDESAEDGTTEKIKDENSWSIAPYVRYSIFEFNKLSLLGKVSLYARGTNDDLRKLSTATFGVSIVPELRYGLTEKIELLASFNVFSLGFSSKSTKRGGNDAGTETAFGFSANTDHVTNLGDIHIGFEYRF